MHNILLIEDDEVVRLFIMKSLQENGYKVETHDSGHTGLEAALSRRFDIIILDRMLPGEVSGLDILEQLRAQQDTTPVMVLSALAAVDERVAGLKAGGDDYMTKPFAMSELLARVEILLRRRRNTDSDSSDNIPVTRLKVGDLELDLLERSVTRRGQKIDLQPREFRLLEFLVRHAGQVVTRAMLLNDVWDYHFDPQTNVIDVHVSRLRQKIDKPFPTPLIQTIRNAGYMLQAGE